MGEMGRGEGVGREVEYGTSRPRRAMLGIEGIVKGGRLVSETAESGSLSV